MARPIKETPTLYGKDAVEFERKIQNPQPVSSEEIERGRRIYEALVKNSPNFR